MRHICTISAAAILATFAGMANAQALITHRSLSLNAAIEMAQAALAQCRSQGYQVSITVLGQNSRALVTLHDDNANPHTIENSLRKAYTALTFRRTSGEYGKAAVANPQSVGALHLDKVTTLEGALPIMVGKELIGSIGISGAPGGDKDAACAQVGLDKIKAGLGS